jgi:hypothetical protein
MAGHVNEKDVMIDRLCNNRQLLKHRVVVR